METNRRILLVDTSIAIRHGLKTLLQPLNIEIVEATNGLDAYNHVSEQPVDVIITSIDMPKMDGLELCRKIKSASATQDISVIILSSFGSDADIDRAIQAGASAYIEKREARARLYDTVQKLLAISPSQPERTILIVEDSRPIRTLIQKGLMEAGFHVISAENGQEALDILPEQHPDLILSDINMPGMDGFELCEALHSDPDFASIPFVVMSTINDRDQMRRIIKYGATDYMVKPFNIDELVIHIERFLEDRLLLLIKEKERLDTERKMMLGSIKSLLAALEAREPRLKEHADAVAHIASGMAEFAGASKREIELVILGAQLHDIGKIALKDEILLISDPADEQILGYLKQHPRIGANILQNIPRLPSEIISIILHHHERPDGKGYPKGLLVEQIPKWAGITAVANTYHQLVASYPYGKKLSQKDALQTIEQMSGIELCTEYVYLFLDWMHSQDTLS